MPARILTALCAIALALVAGGCGAAPEDAAPEREATLVLDFQPNAVHTGIYAAVARGFDDAEGVPLTVQVPASPADGLRLLAGGRADFAVVSIHDLALARERGQDLVAVMALVQRPLSAVLALPGVRRPRELEGRRVGVTGVPSDDAVLRSIVQGDGGDPDAVRTVTIGFEAVRALLAERVAAATAFWNAEGVALRARRPETQEFRVDDFGAPAYPELVLVTARAIVQDDPAFPRALVATLARGYGEVIADPESGVRDLVDATDGLEREAVARELDAVLPAFTAGARSFGELDPERLRAWAAWEARFGITEEPPDVVLGFEGRFVPGPGQRD